MIKSLINNAIRTVLDEFFLNAPSIQISMGADLFSDSKINLSNLTFRPDIFDISLQPFTLVHGHLGSLNVEGVAELALGGQLRFVAENIFLLLKVDKDCDPEKIQAMKKILLEMQPEHFSTIMLADLIRRLQGLSTSPDIDVREKRKVLYKSIDSTSKGLNVTIKGVHIRFEFDNAHGVITRGDSIGFMVPSVKISPAPSSHRPDNINSNDPAWLIMAKSLQFYVDYNRESYNKGTIERTVEHFKNQWKLEIHSAIIVPFDIDIIIGVNIKRNSGLICPQIMTNLPVFKVIVDEQQIRVLRDSILQIASISKKHEQNVKIQKIYRKGFPLPRIAETGGINILPHLSFKNQLYPTFLHTLPSSGQKGLVAFMKDRVGKQWTVMLWKHIIRLVIHDLQVTRPLGRWIELIRLANIRKEYAFTFARLIKRSSTTGNYIFNVHSTMNANLQRQLVEQEMMLSIHAIRHFRTLAFMIAMVGSQHMKRSQSTENWEKMFVSWTDILRIFMELTEQKHESAFHRYDRQHDQDDVDDYYSVAGDRDNDTASVASKGGHVDTTQSATTPSKSSLTRPNSSISTASSTLKGVFSVFGDAFSSSSTASAHGGSSSSSHGHSSSSSSHGYGGEDEYDKKFAKKFDLSLFSTMGKIAEKVEKSKEFGGSANNDPFNAGLFSTDIEHAMRQNAIISGTKRPSIKRIQETVSWAINKFEHPLTIMPPDVQIKVEKLVLEVKTAATFKQKNRLTIANTTLTGCNLTINISRSSSNNNNSTSATTSNAQNTTLKGTKRGFSILTGALVQFRLVASQLSVALSLPVTQNKPPPAQTSTKENEMTLKKGLPAYPTSVVDQSNPLDGGHMLILRRSGSASILSESSDHSASSSSAPLSNNAAAIVRPTVATGPAKPARAPAADRAGGAKGPYTINTRVDNLPAISSPANNNSNKTMELREIISSSSGETFFIFCVILDLDDKGEGAGDVQLAFGGLRVDLSKRILAAMIQPEFASIFSNIYKYYNEISEIMPLMNDPSSVIIDWQEKLPFIVLACDPPVSILERLSKNAQRELLRPASMFYAKPASPQAQQQAQPAQAQPAQAAAPAVIDKDLQSVMINDGNHDVVSSAGASDEVDNEEAAQHEGEDAMITPMPDESVFYVDGEDLPAEPHQDRLQEQEEETEEETLEHRKSRHQAIIFNRNLMQWLGTLEAALPRVLSLCLRTSPIVLQTLEASLLRDLVYAKIHAILDQAANRDVAGRFGDASSLFSTDSLFGLLSHLILATSDTGVAGGTRLRGYTTFTGVRKWGSKRTPGGTSSGVSTSPSLGGAGGVSAGPLASFKVKACIPAVEFVLTKALVPYPALDLHVQGMAVLKVPMSDETLCHYLAWILAVFMPIVK